MLFPTLVERHSAGDRAGFDRALVDTLRLACCGLLLPAAVGGGAAAGIMDLFGPGFGQASAALSVVLLVPALSLMSQSLAHTLMAVDRPLTTSKISIVRGVITMGACIGLVAAGGITSAAIAVVVGYVVDLAIRFYVARGILETPLTRLWPVATMGALAGAYAVGFVTARVIDDAIASEFGVLVALIAGTAAYVATLVIAGGLLPRDRDQLRTLASRFNQRSPVRVPLREAGT
jgi:O-antigen/teichoic acid export membrane protein